MQVLDPESSLAATEITTQIDNDENDPDAITSTHRDPGMEGDAQSQNADHQGERHEQSKTEEEEKYQPRVQPTSEGARLHSVFPKSTRIFIVIMAATCSLVSPLSGNIYFPALNTLAVELHVSSSLINVSLTTYMIFRGLSPMFMGNLADTSGRRPAYLVCFTIYIGACIGLALQTSYPALLILRCLQATGSSSSIALGSAVAADIANAAQRGTYIGLVTGGALTGPALGPVLGGILSAYLGWRSIFWFLVIFAGILLIFILLAFPETSRNVVGDGSIPPQRWNRDLLSVIRQWRARRNTSNSQQTHNIRDDISSRGGNEKHTKRRIKIPNPLATLKLLKEKDVGLLLLYNSLVNTSYFSVTSSLSYLFAQTYGFNDLQIGLCFLPYGTGALMASLFNGRILDWRFRQVARSIGFEISKGHTVNTRKFPLERVRFPVALVLILIGNSALLCYGWTIHVKAPLAAPLVLTFLVGYCVSGSFQCCSVALIDYYPTSPATATAANNFCRCLLGAGEAAVIIQMIDSMSTGWCFTFISMVIYITTPILLVLMRWGPGWREKRAQRIEEDAMLRSSAGRD